MAVGWKMIRQRYELYAWLGGLPTGIIRWSQKHTRQKRNGHQKNTGSRPVSGQLPDS